MSEVVKNTAGQRVFATVCDLNGAPKTSGVSFYVAKDDGAQASAAGTATHRGNGQYEYVFTQGETDADAIGLSWGGTNVTPNGITIFTTTSTLDDIKGQTAAIETDTQDLQTQVGTAATIQAAIQKLLEADLVVDTGTDPWELVWIEKDTGALGAGTELLRKEIRDTAGAAITSTLVVPGRTVSPS